MTNKVPKTMKIFFTMGDILFIGTNKKLKKQKKY